MNVANIKWFVLIAVGILVIVLSPWLAQMYLVSYNKTVRWLYGPLSISRPHLFWLVPGISFILIGLAGLAGFLHW
jgi:hypothetical protein